MTGLRCSGERSGTLLRQEIKEVMFHWKITVDSVSSTEESARQKLVRDT